MELGESAVCKLSHGMQRMPAELDLPERVVSLVSSDSPPLRLHNHLTTGAAAMGLPEL